VTARPPIPTAMVDRQAVSQALDLPLLIGHCRFILLA